MKFIEKLVLLALIVVLAKSLAEYFEDAERCDSEQEEDNIIVIEGEFSENCTDKTANEIADAIVKALEARESKKSGK